MALHVKMTRHPRLVATLLLCGALFLAGCGSVTSLFPLYTDDDLRTPAVDARLEGEWETPDFDDSNVDAHPLYRWRIVAPDGPAGGSGLYEVEVREGGPASHDERTWRFKARLLSIDRLRFFDAEFHESAWGTSSVATRLQTLLVPTHAFGRIWIQQDLLRLSVLSPDWVRANLPRADTRTFAGDNDAHVLVTQPTAAMRELAIRRADDADAFAGVAYLCRPGPDCALRAAEDQLARTPQDADLLDTVAEMASNRGLFTRAADLRQARAALAPLDPVRQADLADAYLLTRDFARAQVAYEEAARLASMPAEGATAAAVTDRAQRGIAWSWFLRGQYEQARLAARYARPGRDVTCADGVLIEYYSLVRLGRDEEAGRVLDREIGAFVGGAAQHLLLIEASGRVTGDSRDWETRAGRSRARYFRALRASTDGHRVAARRLLMSAASEPDDDMFTLAARVELERLDADTAR